MARNQALPACLKGAIRDGSDTTPQSAASNSAAGIRNYVQLQERTAASAAADSWLASPEFPTRDDMFPKLESDGTDAVIELDGNIVEGAWESKDQYLRAHYELLREDGVSPLRTAVHQVRAHPDMLDNKDVSVYEKVCAKANPGSKDRDVTDPGLGLHHWVYLHAARHRCTNTIFDREGKKKNSLAVEQEAYIGHNRGPHQAEGHLSNHLHHRRSRRPTSFRTGAKPTRD